MKYRENVFLFSIQNTTSAIEEELGLVGASAEDDEAEQIRKVCEKEILVGKFLRFIFNWYFTWTVTIKFLELFLLRTESTDLVLKFKSKILSITLNDI